MLKLKADFSPVYELLHSLIVYNSKNNYFDLGKDWSQKLRENLSEPDFLQELNRPDPFPCFSYMHLLIYKSPEKHSVESFLIWFKQLSAGDLYEILAPYLSEGLPMELGEYRDYYVYILEKWNAQYKMDEQIINAVQKRYKEVNSEIGTKNEIALIENLTNGIFFKLNELIESVVLVPTYHNTPLNIVSQLNSLIFVCFPVDLPVEDPDTPPIELVRITKALGDERRLQILQIINSGVSALKEIAREAKLSKSNLHYHLSLLRIAGMIRIINDVSTKYDRYEVRPEMFEKLNNYLLSYLPPQK